MFLKWAILIQIWFYQFLWVLWGKGKRWEKPHFEIFGPTDCDLSTSKPKSSNSNILVSAHTIGKLKIVPEILRSREDMVKMFFKILSVSPLEILMTLQLPLGLISGPRPKRNFRNMSFNFFTQIFHFLSNPNRGDILID